MTTDVAKSEFSTEEVIGRRPCLALTDMVLLCTSHPGTKRGRTEKVLDKDGCSD